MALHVSSSSVSEQASAASRPAGVGPFRAQGQKPGQPYQETLPVAQGPTLRLALGGETDCSPPAPVSGSAGGLSRLALRPAPTIAPPEQSVFVLQFPPDCCELLLSLPGCHFRAPAESGVGGRGGGRPGELCRGGGGGHREHPQRRLGQASR